MGVLDAYATPTEADAFLVGVTIWTNATNQNKLDALLNARYYIDSKFESTFDKVSPPSEVKYASALLAVDYLTDGDLFFTNELQLKKKSVTAGPIVTSKEFLPQKKKPKSLHKVIAILQLITSVSSSNGSSVVNLIR